jgi:hypothetical protein
MLRCTETDGGVIFSVRVVSRASRSSIEGLYEDALRVRIAAPPIEGTANEELSRFLARALGVSLSKVEIVSGHATRMKIVRIANVTCTDVARLV